MEVSIINNNSTTSVRIMFTDTEKEQLNMQSEIDLTITDNISIDDSSALKSNILSILKSFTITTK